jgi:hypothetical protein
MPEFSHLGKMLILFGGIAVLIGLVLLFVDKIPFLGKLPGDIYVEKKNFTFYFPLMTSILISIILTVILNLFGRR